MVGHVPPTTFGAVYGETSLNGVIAANPIQMSSSITNAGEGTAATENENDERKTLLLRCIKEIAISFIEYHLLDKPSNQGQPNPKWRLEHKLLNEGYASWLQKNSEQIESRVNEILSVLSTEADTKQARSSAVDREARAWKEQAGSEFRTWREAAMARLAQLKAYSEQMEAQVVALRDENRALRESAEHSLPPSSPSSRATDCASGFTPEGMTLNRTQLEGMTDANPVLDTIADMLAESEAQSLMLMRQVEALQQQLSELSDERDECAIAD